MITHPPVFSSPTFALSPPEIVVVAEGDTTSAQSSARGNLFERFIAILFSEYGCELPTKSKLNVTTNGYEIDITTRFVLSKETAIAECKAYTSNVDSKMLNAFYGKLTTQRFKDPSAHGWFVAIPGLTSSGNDLARVIEESDKKFRLITAETIYDLVVKRNKISPITGQNLVTSDHAILVTESGLCALAKELDSSTRLPVRVLVKRTSGSLTQVELDLISQSGYASGLSVQDVGAASTLPVIPAQMEAPTLVSVVGSTNDFEYQFPAAPAFFVGRKKILDELLSGFQSSAPTGRVAVLNAQSGWGKSSLALKVASMVSSKSGHATVFDSRTANSVQYVAAALQFAANAAAKKGVLRLPPDASFASLQSSVSTLRQSNWASTDRPLVIFFDQFENVFRDVKITEEFRNLALLFRDSQAPISVGFCWKTDQFAPTENYPYRLRDEIRGAANVINVDPFGPNDVSTVLNRLARAAGTSISKDLRQRIREYSQGLPWLLKKLASHLLKEFQAGVSEESLLESALNIEGLFEQDLANLQVSEREALNQIAREAPVPISDIAERFEPNVIQSLIDQRLVVKVGQRLDTYWDTFREFLVTGNVAVEDTYILRQRPTWTGRILLSVIESGGDVSASEVSASLGTSVNVVFNGARELRQLGILSPKAGSLTLVEQLRAGTTITEADLQSKVSKALRRHKVFNEVHTLLAAAPKAKISIDALAAELPKIYPAMKADSRTWRNYATAFAQWLEYGNLVSVRGHIIESPAARPSSVRLLGGSTRRNRARTFPQGFPAAAINFIRAKIEVKPSDSDAKSSTTKAITDLQILGVLDEKSDLSDKALAMRLLDAGLRAEALLPRLESVPGGTEALNLLRLNPSATKLEVGEILRESCGLQWAQPTVQKVGSMFRTWAKLAGVKITRASS